MYTVVSLRAEDRFKSANAVVPEGLNIVHVAATDEDTIAEACEAALIDALKEGKISGAAVDVFTQEPLPAHHPFLDLPAEISNRLLLTPHVAGLTRESLRRMMQTALDNIARVARGEKPLYVVNGVG